MPRSFYLLTAFGKDRPGIVAEVTRLVFKTQGNIEDASMTRLGGEFTMMMIIALSTPTAAARFQRDLTAIQKKNRLELNFKPIAAAQALSKKQTPATHLISIYGTDRPGIVYRAAQEIADQGINITDLNTKMLRRAGHPLYVMLLEVHIASAAKAGSVLKRLNRLGHSLHLDVTLQDIDPVAL